MKHEIDNSLLVNHRYFLDCNHAFLLEILRCIHRPVAAATQQCTVASLIDVVSILTHINTKQTKLPTLLLPQQNTRRYIYVH